ncbi:MAG: bifunctional methylenetetrahydrofolate dehydrogenase/methenyltetrahydrofolate cyclohydrolase FolD [Nitrospina sp.]|nr:bifunctional methylenetetrahydrofolate dehydrogenase/methenyltetrahydrofolate cyclohydrolase FolD [Nitrospina sp.]
MGIIDGKMVATKIKENIAIEVKSLKKEIGQTPGLAVVLVGDDPASAVYVRSKNKTCANLGFQSFEKILPAHTKESTLLELIDELNKDEKINGILVQLPLPSHISSHKILEAINPNKDVDGFHLENIGRLVTGNAIFKPCTPEGIIQLLDYYKVKIEGENAVILGRSNIVGKPISFLLLERNATVTICHSRTQNLSAITRSADILIAAIGKPNFVTADMIKDEAVIIDVGINRVDNKLIGDVDYQAVLQKASLITPVPGGVGPMTIAMLMANTLQSFKNFYQLN